MKKYLLSIFLLMFAAAAWAQTRVITGQIIDPQQQAMIGVVIVQKGTNNATVTDAEGKFSLTVPDTANVTLVASYVGYKEKEIQVGAQSQVSVTMEEDVEAEEVVVVGYGTVKKSDLTGAVVSLKPEDVKQVPSGSPLDAIQGKAPGVDIVTTNGSAGQQPNVVVRGNRSITADNGPLYVVDGVQYSSIQDINPNDIQSMEVLKDASATAIYGARGANGVIIITTKKGASGAVKVSVNTYAGISSVLAFPQPMNGQQYADLQLEAYKEQNPADPNPTYQKALSAQDITNYNKGVTNDYLKQILHKGSQEDVNFNVSGGTDKMKTYFSLDYFKQKGLLKNDILNRYTGRLNIDYQVFKFLKVGSQTQITFYDQSKRANPIGNAVKLSPFTSPYNDDGTLNTRPDGRYANPLLDEQPNTAVDKLKTTRIFPTIYAEVAPLKNLTARTNLAINWDNRGEGIFYAGNSYTRINNGTPTNWASYDAQRSVQLNWQGIINYNTKIKDHSIGLTALSETIGNKSEKIHSESIGQLLPSQSYYNLADHTSSILGSSYTQKNLISFAGRLNYSFKDKYLLTMTGRYDGASQLAPGHKWSFFPSIAAGWKLTEEKFMEKVKSVFNLIKVRGSYGIVGNFNINPYSTQSNLIKIPFSYDDNSATAYVYKPLIGNTNTKWERSYTWDGGLDLGILQNRITFTFDYYNTITKDLLLTENLPLSTGVSQTVSNVGSTRNKGIEIALTSNNIDTKNFSWTTTISFMRNREQILALEDGITRMQITDASGTLRYVNVGHPVNSFYDYQKVGIWQSNEAATAASYGAKPGQIKIKDQNGDGQITPDDRVVVGTSVPKWSGGFNSEFKFFKKIDLSFYWYARVGQTILYQYQYNPTGNINSLSTRDYWTPNNPTNDLPVPGATIPTQFQNAMNYMDGSFLKLRSVNIGYTLPEKFSKKFGMSRLRIYANGKNLLVFSKIKHYDPEMAGNLTFPTVRLFVGGLTADF